MLRCERVRYASALAFSACRSSLRALALALFFLFRSLLFGRIFPTKQCCLLACLFVIVFLLFLLAQFRGF